MALPRTWLPRAEEIVGVLRRMKAKHLDRSAIEELFQLQRRAAIDLMNAGGVSGDRRTGFLADRSSLLSWTQKLSQDESLQRRRRKETSDELSQCMAEVQAVRAAMEREGKTPVSFPDRRQVSSRNGRFPAERDQDRTQAYHGGSGRGHSRPNV